MTLLTFAKKYKLSLSKDECDEYVVKGAHGDISQYDDTLLLASFYGPDESSLRAKRISETVKKHMAHNGFSISKGTDEVQFMFDPLNSKASKWFIKSLWCKEKRSRTKRPQPLKSGDLFE